MARMGGGSAKDQDPLCSVGRSQVVWWPKALMLGVTFQMMSRHYHLWTVGLVFVTHNHTLGPGWAGAGW